MFSKCYFLFFFHDNKSNQSRDRIQDCVWHHLDAAITQTKMFEPGLGTRFCKLKLSLNSNEHSMSSSAIFTPGTKMLSVKDTGSILRSWEGMFPRTDIRKTRALPEFSCVLAMWWFLFFSDLAQRGQKPKARFSKPAEGLAGGQLWECTWVLVPLSLTPRCHARCHARCLGNLVVLVSSHHSFVYQTRVYQTRVFPFMLSSGNATMISGESDDQDTYK